jgi:Ser/Thr protein kinase RdoA (MazF antagonist)
MLEWVSYLAEHGAPVAAPLTSSRGHLLESLVQDGVRYTLTAFEKASGTLAETIPISAWSPDLFHSIGRSVGKFHRISASYRPSLPSHIRPQWFDSYEIQEATKKLTLTSEPARNRLSNLLEELHNLPKSATDFGIIHNDLHFANFIIRPDGQVTIIDFDDCVYGWFAMDIAMALFDVLVIYDSLNDEDSQDFARSFLSSYLSGYRQEYDLTRFWQEQIPKFLKLKELCIYADLIDHADRAKPGSWVGNFMVGRSDRINADLPYVDIDFGDL